MWRHQFDAHLRAAAAYLTNPAHHRNAPALIRTVLNSEHFPGLQFGGHFARPRQAITAGTVIDHRQACRSGSAEGCRCRSRLRPDGRTGFLRTAATPQSLPCGAASKAWLQLSFSPLDYRVAEVRRAGAGMFEQFAEAAFAAQVKVQGAHADAHGQVALTGGALKTALGGLAPSWRAHVAGCRGSVLPGPAAASTSPAAVNALRSRSPAVADRSPAVRPVVLCETCCSSAGRRPVQR